MLCTASDEALPLKEALDELGIDRSTFYRYCANGRLGKYVHAGKTYVPISVIKDYKARLLADAQKEQARNARSAHARRSA